jgi:predicted DNA-binding transcriptional regulator AlpA
MSTEVGAPILRTPAAARFLGLGESTLEKMRLSGSGPAFVKLGSRAVGYDVEVLRDYLKSRTRRSTSDDGGADAKPNGAEGSP